MPPPEAAPGPRTAGPTLARLGDIKMEAVAVLDRLQRGELSAAAAAAPGGAAAARGPGAASGGGGGM